MAVKTVAPIANRMLVFMGVSSILMLLRDCPAVIHWTRPGKFKFEEDRGHDLGLEPDQRRTIVGRDTKKSDTGPPSPISGLGQSRRFGHLPVTSGLPLTPDMALHSANQHYVPDGDMRSGEH